MPDSGNAMMVAPLDVTAEQFRAAMASFAAGVTVVATLDAAERPCALTATAFTSVSMNPPRCLVCIHKHARPYQALMHAGRFAVNILGAEQEQMSSRFAAPIADRFAGVAWSPGTLTGCPLIEGALAWLECDVAEVHASGDHDIVVGALRSVRVRDGSPLVYFRGSCTSLSPLPAQTTASRKGQQTLTRALSEKGVEPAKQRQEVTEVTQKGKFVKQDKVRPTAPNVADVPPEFQQYLVDQQYDAYLPQQQELWREVLRRNQQLVNEHGRQVHPAYVDGMRQLELPPRIPRLEELNERLAFTGWSTVCVDGYVPSQAYAGLMARRIFPVSRQIRRREHLEFAPAPDMVHDVLGHLAMLYLPEHREFLRCLSAVMENAEANQLDADFYSDSVRMAELKWDSASPAKDVTAAERRVEDVHRALTKNASELTHLRRMYVWSVEFGLMGTVEEFRVFGAAFFSSPTEFLAVCERRAPILPYSLDVINYENAFSDLLTQYFVTPSFEQLQSVLEQYQARGSAPSITPRTSEIRDIRPTVRQKRRKNA